MYMRSVMPIDRLPSVHDGICHIYMGMINSWLVVACRYCECAFSSMITYTWHHACVQVFVRILILIRDAHLNAAVYTHAMKIASYICL